ncbi:phosphoribosylamine--glycine ligase [Eremomyces bilateralis CBS 781.70]|uniref:phosphoribosylamine--glycine ligase n=1 Tax=Eremomyces bilateralis CBS 781.70 TaxID=1392243 RepID=A0A6G1FVM3_9PEZI|nr:phosphoribosylamine--glycine ligase [Eremomyces bilateralis CBS 781.70]KAF1809834.1 phosphoribosylamine--glycine ligase [Eremomyces bilateralis CBS 781.70]
MAEYRVLLIGNGGREHALAWKLAQSPLVSNIYCAPGNGGTASVPKCENLPISGEDFPSLLSAAHTRDVNLVVPGPEAPLVAGVTDYFKVHAPLVLCFGPSKAAAQLEGSKAFSKDFMKHNAIPTAAYENFKDYDAARKYLDSVSHPVVIKASGLAAGKGVIIPTSKEEAQAALREIMVDKEFGSAGDEVVIEEFLEGDEISILSLCDGSRMVNCPPAQDHKRIGDGDIGPNTGGMGTYAPAPVCTGEMMKQIEKEVLDPTIRAMKESGHPMIGCLFTGLMLTKNGPKVLEYNVRFGDPETQSVLMLLDSDLAEIIVACANGSLESVNATFSSNFAATVVVAAGGYPGPYKKGIDMQLDATPDGIVLFHAGTSTMDKLKTAGGRVIASSASASTLQDAVKAAYHGVNCIHFDGMQYRRDIAARALK